MIKKNILWSIAILCVWIISLLPITAEGETWRDILTEEQQKEIDKRLYSGVWGQHDWEQFKRNYEAWPTADQEARFKQAMDNSMSAKMFRESIGILEGFANPQIGVEAAKEHYREHGPVSGTLRIALSPVTIPIRSWREIVGSEPGLGEYPLKVLIGAAVVILWGALILSKQTKQTKYNYKAALSRLTITISIIIFIVYSIIDGWVSGLTFILYAALFLGIQYLIMRWILYYVILGVYHYVILWIYRGLKQEN